MQIFHDIIRISAALQILFLIFPLKWGIMSTRFWNSSLNLEFSVFVLFVYLFIFSKLKIFFWSFQLFVNGRIHNVVLTLINVVKLDFENNVVSILYSVVNINVKIDSIDLTLFNMLNFNIEIHNFVSTLTWRCSMLQHHINLTTLKCLLCTNVSKEKGDGCYDSALYIFQWFKLSNYQISSLTVRFSLSLGKSSLCTFSK